MRSLAFRAFHTLRPGDDLLHRWQEAERYQWMSSQAQREIQLARLESLLAHARHHVPHFRQILPGTARPFDLNERGHLVWSDVPILDKTAIRENTESFLCDLPEIDRLPNATSGSTGESLRFFLDAGNRSVRAAATHRFHRWAGIEPFDRQAKLWGARFDSPRSGLRQRLTNILHPLLFLSSYELSDEDMHGYARRLREFGPRLLTSYPSPLEHFAHYWREANCELPELHAIICSAEQLHVEQRHLFEAVFGCPVFDRYGSREFANVAQECEEHDGLHVATDRIVLEVVDADGQPVVAGQRGEVLITDLDNRAMPFIRYRTGDLATWAQGDCRCGRSLPRLASLEGRVLDLIHGPGGAVISGTFWPQIVKQTSVRVRLFQVVQSELERVRIRLVMSPPGPLSPGGEARLLERIQTEAPGLMAELEYVDDIPLTPGGKRRTVIGNIGVQSQPEERGSGGRN